MKSLQQLDEHKAMLFRVPADLLSRLPSARWAPIPLRLIVGYGFMEHGFAKLGRGSDSFAAILHAIGVPAPHFMAWVDDTDRNIRRFSDFSGRFRCACQPTDGRNFIGRHVYRASALRIQFDQTPWPSLLPVRSLGSRVMNPIFCISRRSHLWSSAAPGHCLLTASFEVSSGPHKSEVAGR